MDKYYSGKQKTRPNGLKINNWMVLNDIMGVDPYLQYGLTTLCFRSFTILAHLNLQKLKFGIFLTKPITTTSLIPLRTLTDVLLQSQN